MGYFTNEKRNGYKDFHFSKGTTSIVFEGYTDDVDIVVTEGSIKDRYFGVPERMIFDDEMIRIKSRGDRKEIFLLNMSYSDFIELAAALGVITHDFSFNLTANKATYTP